MKSSFTIARASLQPADDERLLRQVVDHTGSEDEAASILRSLRRLGQDGSIVSYEIVPTPERASYRGSRPVVWSVRAIRH